MSSRISITLDDYTKEIVDKIFKVSERKTKSGIINYIINDWINKNPQILRDEYHIDINEIRKKHKREFTIDNIREKQVLEFFRHYFKGIYRIKITNLSDKLNIPSNRVTDIFLDYCNFITKEFNIVMDDVFFVNRDNKY